jgi:hypothetical protein
MVIWWYAGVDGFLLLQQLFSSSLSLSLSLFVVMVAAGGVGVMVKD